MINYQPSISTERKVTSYLNSLNIEYTTTYYAGNTDRGLEHAPKCCGIPILIDIGSPTAK